MIEAFVGLVGGGKSYNSVRRMLNYIASGRSVVSNILLSGWDKDNNCFLPSSPVPAYLERKFSWRYQPGQYLYIPFDDMVSLPGWFSRVPGGSDRDHRTFLCIDEATDLFDTLDRGKMSDPIYRELFRFLRLSRHAHIDVMFICQDLNAINSRLRGLVSFIWRSTDLSTFRIGGLKVALPLNCFLLQQFDRTGKLETRREFVSKDPQIFSLYESEAFHNSLGITFSSPVGNGRLEVRKMKKWQVVLLFVAVAFGVVSFFRGLESEKTIRSELQKLRLSVEASSSPDGKQVATPSSVEVPSPPPPSSPPSRSRRVVRGVFRFVETPKQCYCYVNGDLYRVGMWTEYGLCRVVSRDLILCVDDDFETVILPAVPAGAGASDVSFQVVPGCRTAPRSLDICAYSKKS